MLKPCLECKREISATANPCPHCGRKTPHGTSPVVKYGGGFLLAFFLLAAVLGARAQHGTPAPPAPPAPPSDPLYAAKASLLQQCKVIIKSGLEAPLTAEWPGLTDEVQPPTLDEQSGIMSWIAWVKYKNAFNVPFKRGFVCTRSTTQPAKVEFLE